MQGLWNHDKSSQPNHISMQTLAPQGHFVCGCFHALFFSMAEEDITSIINTVQDYIDDIVGNVSLGTAERLRVRRMGSREYGCASKTSDLDLYLMIPDALEKDAKNIRMKLGSRLEGRGQAKSGRQCPKDQTANFTIKWTSTTADVDVSLLVAVESVITNAVSATRCLVGFFAKDNTSREIIRMTLARLREKKVLNMHGRQTGVGQSLKTVSCALLCIALMKERSDDVCKACTESQCRWLLRALSAFDATAFCVQYDWVEDRSYCYLAKLETQGTVPMHIMRRGRNSAG